MKKYIIVDLYGTGDPYISEKELPPSHYHVFIGEADTKEEAAEIAEKYADEVQEAIDKYLDSLEYDEYYDDEDED